MGDQRWLDLRVERSGVIKSALGLNCWVRVRGRPAAWGKLNAKRRDSAERLRPGVERKILIAELDAIEAAALQVLEDCAEIRRRELVASESDAKGGDRG